MARVIGAFVLGLALGTACLTHAETEPTEATIGWAQDVGVDPWDLQGALNTTGMRPEEYLQAVGLLTHPVALLPALAVARVRLTHYVEGGVTYSGGHTFPGSAACSWNFALGTRLRLPDGEEFVCNDRGLLGSTGWVDLWRRPDLVRKYGSWVVVEVLR